MCRNALIRRIERREASAKQRCPGAHRGRMGPAGLGGTGRCIPVGSRDGMHSTPRGGGGDSSPCPCGQSRTGQHRDLNQRQAVLLGCMGSLCHCPGLGLKAQCTASAAQLV